MRDILREAYRDELTGVYNRKYLNLIFEREFARSKRYGDSLSLMILDLDNFKEINDAYGHLEGDKTLVKFAGVLQDTVRESDTIVRYGGDEFVIIIPSTSYEGATRLGERILENLKKVKTPLGHLSASIGIATYPEHGVDFKGLFEYADRCLYDAKRSGKGRVGVYKDSNLAPSIPTAVLVGRRDEKNYIIKATKDPFRLHFVAGDAGAGKTRLLMDTLTSLNYRFAFGMAYGAITAMPYIAVRTLLLEILKKFPVEFKEAYGKISEASKREIVKLVPQLGVSQSQGMLSGDKFTLFAAVSELFTHLSFDTPFILVFDDLHWADSLSLELVYYLLHMMLPNLVIFATYRNDEVMGTPLENTIHLLGRERMYDELLLPPMSEGEVKLLAENILKRGLSQELVQKIYEFSGGNPFFVEEFIRTHFDAGSLKYENGKWNLYETGSVNISRSIKDTIERKIERLEDRERDVIRYAACMGKSFYPEVVSGALGMNMGEVYGVLDRLVKINILSESDRGEFYSFKEDAIRLVVLDDMGEGIKRVIYRSIGEFLEQKYGVNEDNVEMILHYYELSGERKKLALYGELAGDRAARVYAYEDALKYYTYALEGAEDEKKKGELHRKIGTAHIHLGKYEEALEHFDNALKFLPEEKGDIEGRFIAYTYNLMGEREKAIEFYRKAIEHTDNPAEKCGFRFMLAFHLSYKGSLTEAEDMAHKALRELPDDALEVKALGNNTLATIYEMFGDAERLGKAEEYFLKALDLGNKGNASARNMAAFYNNLGGYYARRGMFEESLKMFLEAKKLHEETNFAYGKSMIYGNLSMLYMDMGRCAESIECASKGIKINGAMGRSTLNIPLYLVRGEMYFELCRFDEAKKDLLKVLECSQNRRKVDYLHALTLLHKLAVHMKDTGLLRENREKLFRYIVEGSMDALDAVLYEYFINEDSDMAVKIINNNEDNIDASLENAGLYNKLLYNIWKFVFGISPLPNISRVDTELKVKDRVYFYYLVADGYKRRNEKEKSLYYINEAQRNLDGTDLVRLKNLVVDLNDSFR